MARIEQSLFDNNTRSKGADEYYKVVLSRASDVDGKTETVTGLMQEGMQLSFAPEYTTLGAAIPLLGTVSGKLDALSIVESPLLFDGAHTQKMFSGSSHMNLSLKLKIVDINAEGLPVEYARMLASWCQPLDYDLFKKDLANKIGTGRKVLNQIKTTAGDAITSYKDGASVESIINEAEKGIGGSLNTLTSLSRMAVKVKIGDFFKGKDFVITGLTENFSYEQGLAGPMWVDLDITLESLKVLTSTQIKEYFYENQDGVAIRGQRINFIEG